MCLTSTHSFLAFFLAGVLYVCTVGIGYGSCIPCEVPVSLGLFHVDLAKMPFCTYSFFLSVGTQLLCTFKSLGLERCTSGSIHMSKSGVRAAVCVCVCVGVFVPGLRGKACCQELLPVQFSVQFTLHCTRSGVKGHGCYPTSGKSQKLQ